MSLSPLSLFGGLPFLLVATSLLALSFVPTAPALAQEPSAVEDSAEIDAPGPTGETSTAQDSVEDDTDVPAVLPPLAEVLSGEAREAYDAARLLFADGDFGGASAKFRRAYDLEPDPRLLWNQAACEKEQRHYARASQLIERYLEEGGERLPEARRQGARATLTALEGFSSRITLEGAPAGARILVDGVEVATTPLAAPLHLDLGTRKLTIEHDGYEPFHRTLTIPGNTDISVEIDLAPKTTEPAHAEVPQQQDAREAPKRSSLLATKWPAIAAAGAGLAGAAVWTIFGVQSMNAKSKSKAECEGDICTDRGVSLRKDAIDAGNVATVGMIVAGVGWASAGVLWFTLPARRGEEVGTHRPRSPINVQQVRVGAGVGTLRVTGRW